MTTFSQIVDELVLQEFRRPELLETAASYLRQVIREVHSKPNGAAILFGENRVEDEIITTAAPHIWLIPAPQNRFQQMEAVWSVNFGCYLDSKTPNTIYRTIDNPSARFYHYRSGASFVMNGVSVGSLLKISYFQYPAILAYYPEATRPAVYDYASGAFAVDAGFAGTNEEALALVTNWLLLRHSEILKEGVRSKMYRRINSESQAKMSYSAFQEQRLAINAQEGA